MDAVQVVTIAVEEARGRVPVVAGTGYGWAQAARLALDAPVGETRTRGAVDAGGPRR
ncbi:hypothetical protein [Streptomyces sp. NPDC004014]